MNGRLQIVAYSIDRGTAVWISTPCGTNLAFDLGRSANFSPLVDIYSNGVRTLDAVFITHPHLDHFNDIDNLRYFTVGRFFRSNVIAPVRTDMGAGRYSPNEYAFLSNIYAQYNGTRLYETSTYGVNQGQLTANDGVVLDVFAPQGQFSSVNDYSLVTVLSYGRFRMVLFGDNGPESIVALYDDPRFRQSVQGAQVFLAPHHGRESGWSDLLGELLAPEICLVSDGRTSDPVAIAAYDRLCVGKAVSIRGQLPRQRKCVTTRTDGHIVVTVDPAHLKYGEYAIKTCG